jgi:hypothetical protein
MATKFFNICRKEEYETKSGDKKTSWPQVGRLIQGEDGKMSITLNMIPGKFYVFEQEAKQGGNRPPADEIPF